ncbi:E3 ubiquitin-protein ligase AMFR-like [Saccostrea echinata]|uniref:E3 ubiquitin-protein ligase AMFR-like n=1 Tax=Saccostrea echinata TaxID=191078 RepID=UPI002A807CC4|nr:E3 ubiquitin-protein ligase AMFR-like [Saccostrea echinata]
MPVILLERIPLPSLQTYTSVSVLVLSVALYYAYHMVSTFDTLTVDLGDGAHGVTVEPVEDDEVLTDSREGINMTLPYDTVHWNMFHILTTEVWCVWILVNSAYCCLILLGKAIQKLVFGELRVSEEQHLKDKFWNFLFYKFIFIFGVLNVQTLEEVVSWVAWFTILGFFNLLTQLSKDRFEYLSFSPIAARGIHLKLLGLLFVILLCSFALLFLSGYVGLQTGPTIFAFLAAECLLLGIRALYVVVRYVIHLWDMTVTSVWENKSIYIYYTELGFELAYLAVDFAHHLHMLLWGNIFLSMASLVICMQLRYLFYEFKRRINRHKNYRRVVQNMEARFPMATKEELQGHNDNCAVCWERMEGARKLPCGHLFHNSCLRSWLEQDTSCPTCRMSLNEGPQVNPNLNVLDERGAAPPQPPQQQPQNQFTNHFFHFDGSRYVSWFPSFSVEVTHTQLLPGGRQRPVQTSQLDSMARQVQSVFPHIPMNVIIEDLRNTRSVDFTIENILEGRVQVPPPGLTTMAALTDSEEGSDDSDAQSGISQSSSRALQLTRPAEGAEEVSSIMDDNVPFLMETKPSDETHFTRGGRFSKSASERETMLQSRKEQMLQNARKKYLSRQTSSEKEAASQISQISESPENSTTGQSELQQRRELAFQAAQRRFNSS